LEDETLRRRNRPPGNTGGMVRPRVVRFRTKKKLASLSGKTLAGAIAVIPVTERNARQLESWVEHVRRTGVHGVQLVWDGSDPAPERVLLYVFRVLELARATLSEAPIVLAATDEPVSTLLGLIRAKRKT